MTSSSVRGDGERPTPESPNADGDRPFFSIVTVTLNAGAALQRTVDSIAAQTFRGFEHVVKDAGSKDGSIQALRADYGPRVVSAPDHGIYEGMNQAISLCRGRFVQFLNAGDTLAGPDVLARIARAIERHPGCGIFYCEHVNARRRLRSAVPERATPFYLYRRPICHQAWFVDLDCYRRVGPFDLRYRLSADHDFLVRAVVAHGFTARRVPVLGVEYEGAGVSASRESRVTLVRETADIRARHFTRHERWAYGFALGLTAPRLRRWIAGGPLGSVYDACLNTVRRVRS